MAKKIEDFGEKIGGARKEMYIRCGIKQSDIAEMNDADIVKYVCKDNIWVKPNYMEYKGKMEPACILFMKRMRDDLKARLPSTVYKHKIEIYINFITEMKEFCESIRTKEDLKNIKKLFNAKFDDDKGLCRYLAYDDDITNIIRIRRKIQKLYMSSYERQQLEDEAYLQNFPDRYVGKLKGAYFMEYDGKIILHGVPDVREVKGKRLSFDSKEEAKEYVDNVYLPYLKNKDTKTKRSRVVNIVRPLLERIERIGPDLRNNNNVTTDIILNGFKFRGGEFGNWNNQKDRQAYLNYAYDAFMDLSFAMGLPRDIWGLGKIERNGAEKRLAIAFGSRGVPNAAAHYETDNVVINLTKLNGAGSLAHEFGHALDDYIGSIAGIGGIAKYITVKLASSDATEVDSIYELNELVNSGEERAVVADIITAMNKVVRLIAFDMPLSTERIQAAVNDVYRNEIIRSNMKITFDRTKPDGGLYTDEEHKASVREEVIRRGMVKTTGKSEYMLAAEELDKERYQYYHKRYYSLMVEMFARAFESYINDKLDKNGITSKYLVHSTDSKYYGEYKPYPIGREREIFYDAFEELMSSIRNYIIFKRGDEAKKNIATLNNVYARSKRVSYIENIINVDKKVQDIEASKEAIEYTGGNKRVEDGAREGVLNRVSDNANINITDTAGLRELILNSIKNRDKLYVDVRGNGLINKCMDSIAISAKAKLQLGAIGTYNLSGAKDVLGNSKAYTFTTIPNRGPALLIDENAKSEKQLEGLIEGVVDLIVRRQAQNEIMKQLLHEGITYGVCKTFGLDVRTYCRSELFEKLIQMGNGQVQQYVKSVNSGIQLFMKEFR